MFDLQISSPVLTDAFPDDNFECSWAVLACAEDSELFGMISVLFLFSMTTIFCSAAPSKRPEETTSAALSSCAMRTTPSCLILREKENIHRVTPSAAFRQYSDVAFLGF